MPEKKSEEKSSKSAVNPFLRFTGLAFQMGVLIGLGAWGGSELDAYVENQKPIWTIVFCLTAIGISLYLIIKEALRLSDNGK